MSPYTGPHTTRPIGLHSAMLDGLTVLCVVAVLLVGVVACWLACDRGWVSSRRWPGPWGYPVLGVLPKIYLSENATKVNAILCIQVICSDFLKIVITDSYIWFYF